jgi:tetratricopeptide (TPR) repeat protein
VQTLQVLARRQPGDVDLLMDLGRAYESDGRLEDAYQVYRHILDLSFAPPLDVYLLLARTSAQLGRHVEARIFVDDYLSLGGSDTGIAQWRALLR